VNQRRLKQKLPRSWTISRSGRDLHVTTDQGAVFRVNKDARWTEEDLALYLKSKIPIQIHRHD